LKAFSSVNVTGVSVVAPVSKIEGTTTTSIVPQVVNGTTQRQQTSAITTTVTAPASPITLSQLPKQSNSTRSISVTTATDVPIVVRPLPNGSCPQGYHLVSGAVCIKDITPPTKITASPLSTTPITNATKSFSLPLHSANQPNTNPASNGAKRTLIQRY
jgi:hypothetical protein